MGSVLIQLLPLIIGSLMMPTWVLLVLFMLRSAHGRPAAIAFVGGVTLTRLLQGLIFGTALSASKIGHLQRAAGTVVSTLLLVVGILMWVTALKYALQQSDDDFGSPLPKLMDMVNAITPLRALGLGMLLVTTSSRAWIFTLTALGIIGQARLDIISSGVAFLLFVLGTELLLLAPILISMRWSAWLDTAAQWLEKHNRPIMVIVSFVVGGFFLWRGLAGLLS